MAIAQLLTLLCGVAANLFCGAAACGKSAGDCASAPIAPAAKVTHGLVLLQVGAQAKAQRPAASKREKTKHADLHMRRLQEFDAVEVKAMDVTVNRKTGGWIYHAAKTVGLEVEVRTVG